MASNRVRRARNAAAAAAAAAAAGGQQAVALPPQVPSGPPPMPTDFEGHSQHLLTGAMLKENPYMQAGLLDPARREANRTLAMQQAALNEQAEAGGGAFGGDIYQAMQTRLGSAMQQNLAGQQNAMLAGNYNSERANMMEALRGLGSFETAGLDRESAEGMHSASIAAQIQRAQIDAANALALQGNQLDFNRQGLALDTMNSQARNQLSEAQFMAGLSQQGFGQELALMQLMGQMGLGAGQQQLSALGMAPGLEQAGYTGYGAAYGAEQGVNQQDAAAAAARANIDAQNAQNAWNFDRNNEQGSFDNYLRNLLALNSVGSGSEGERSYSSGQAAPDPWAAGLGNALATFGNLGGFNPTNPFVAPGADPWTGVQVGDNPMGIQWGQQSGNPNQGVGPQSSGGGSSQGGGGGGSWGGGGGSGYGPISFPSGFSPLGWGPQQPGSTTFQGYGGPNPYAGIIPYAGTWGDSPSYQPNPASQPALGNIRT